MLGVTCAAGIVPRSTAAKDLEPTADDCVGVLVDTTACIGCRKCEWACNRANQLPDQPLEVFENVSVFASHRRPDATHYTVVNRFPGATPAAAPVHVKSQCMHCIEPACASACLVSALKKQTNGAVTYDPWRCMGCRYCMVVCPFGVPAYEYHNPTTPRVRKCSFCYARVTDEGRLPACVEVCPPQCLIFGGRDELLQLAHRRIRMDPDRYVDHVFGETEAGGTSWLYLASVPFPELLFPTLAPEAPSRLTESLQHGLFKDFIPPLSLFAVLAAVKALTRSQPTHDGFRDGEQR
jgi:Fe-S-cluster-containing dehydrogenase component